MLDLFTRGTSKDLTVKMAALKNVKSLYETLKAEWSKKDINLDLCEEILNHLKVCII